MAPGLIPQPGSQYGPCVESCEHTDCASNRRMAGVACTICGKPIGYDELFFQDAGWTLLSHADCLDAQVDRERAAAAP